MLYSVLSLLWLLCGFIAAAAMLLRLGSNAEWPKSQIMLWAHRAFGAVFMIGYVVFLGIMIDLYQEDAPILSRPIMVHAALGILLLPILLFKELIVRFFKKYYIALPYVGMTIFCIAFAAVAMTGGHKALLYVAGPRAEVMRNDKAQKVSVALGRDLMHAKCSRCHELKLPYSFQRTEKGWRTTVEHMAEKDPGIISPDQSDSIVGYLKAHLGESK
ncbi:MAG: hypothetical protein AB1696_05810 [Planctomycetota bacterium]